MLQLQWRLYIVEWTTATLYTHRSNSRNSDSSIVFDDRRCDQITSLPIQSPLANRQTASWSRDFRPQM